MLKRTHILPFALASLFASSLLSGCSVNSTTLATSNVQSAAIKGKVFGGQQPVTGSTVTVWLAGTTNYGMGATQLASVTSDATGNFLFPANSYTCPYNNAPVYITASGGNPGAGTNANLVLAAGLGSCSSAQSALVDINEVTTAATAFALSHFFTTSLGGDYTTDLIGGPSNGAGIYNPGLVLANTYTIPNLVNLATGTVNPNTSTVTIEAAKIYSIANTLAACVNSTGLSGAGDASSACAQLFTYTNPGTGAPNDTFQAAVQMALYPFNSVSPLYNLGGATPPFPGLATTPNDWTIGISYTSPSLSLGIAGTSTSRTSTSMDIDANNLIWFPSNSATSHGLAFFDPTTVTFGGPYATTLVQPQYVAITNQGVVFGTDVANPSIAGVSTSAPGGAVTAYTTTGNTGPIVAATSPNSPDDALLYTAGGTASSLGVELYAVDSGSIQDLDTFSQPVNNLGTYAPGSGDVDAATSGSSTPCNYESNISGTTSVLASTASPCVAGGLAITTGALDGVMTAATTNQLCDFGGGPGNGLGSCFTSPVALTTPEGIALDGDGNLWVANSGNASISTLGYVANNFNSTDYFQTSPIQYLHNSTNGNTMTTPYGIAIDNSGNVWVTNAGCISTTGTACAPGAFVLSELVGAAAPTITPLASQSANVTQGTRPVAPPVPAAVHAHTLGHHRAQVKHIK